LVLLEEAVPSVFNDALDADVLPVTFAIELEGLVMESAKLMILADLFLLASKL
jgi:hypothetical protein